MMKQLFDSKNAPNFCPVCESMANFWRSKICDDVNYQIHRCSHCGHGFVSPRPSFAWLKNWYAHSGHHASKIKIPDQISLDAILSREINEPNASIDARRIIKIARTMSIGNEPLRLLDIGCGYGFFSKEALRQGFSITPLELATQERGIAAEFLGVDPIATSFEEFTPPLSNEQFDVVLMSQILEHACDINLWIEKVHGLLCKSGVLAIALPNFNSFLRFILNENEPYIVPPAHLNFFTTQSLSTLLAKHGFAVEFVQHVSRIPQSAIERRLPSRVRVVPRLVWTMGRSVLKIIDIARLGMIINLYARKK